MLFDIAITVQIFYPKLYTNKDGVIHCSGLPSAQLLQLHVLYMLIMMLCQVHHNLIYSIHARRLFLEQSWGSCAKYNHLQ